jgi:hypothetical protein
MRVIVAASVLLSSGCAYFTPAFMTQPSQLRARAQLEEGVLVCERQSLTRKECTVMPHSEVSRMLSEGFGRY